MSDNSQETTAPTAPESANEQVQTTETTTEINVAPVEQAALPDEPAAEQKDYSWVPAKFLRGGTPDFEAMTKSYTSLEKKIGQKGSFAPESIDDYEYEPQHIQLDPESNKAFKQFAKDAGLSTAQYAAVLEQYEQAVTQVAETPEKAKVHLEQAWGNDFEKHAANARLAYETYVPSDIPIEAIGNNPYLLRVLANIGAELREDPMPSTGQKGSSGGTSLADIQKLMGEKDYFKNDKKQTIVSEWYAKNG